LHVVEDTFRNFPPVILGHEFAGTIVETGPTVGRFGIGDRVTVLGAMTVTCGRCVYCRKGEFMFCPERRGMGHGVNGAFAPFVVAREEQLFRLPDSLPTEEGAMVEPFAAAAHAVCDIDSPRLGDVVLMSGPGPIGLMCLKLLLAQGIKTIVAGTGADRLRLEFARQAGAARVVNVEEMDLTQAVRDETDGFGVDLAFECSGAAASAVGCLKALRPLGRYVQVGHFGRDVTLPFDQVAFKQVRVSGSVGYTADTWNRVLRILGEGRVRLGDLITHRLRIEEWERGFAACRDKSALKALLTARDEPMARKAEAVVSA
jgi:L-iditol 2-dehydrogenase